MLVAKAGGYSDDRRQRVEAPDTGVVIQLAEQGRVTGIVVDGATNQPMPRFRVSVRSVSANSATYGRPMKAQLVKDSVDGSYEITGLEEGTYVVQAYHSDYAPTCSDTFQITQGIETPDVVVRLTRGGRIVGVVIDANTREPVVGAEVATFDNNYIDNPFSRMLKGAIPRMTANKKTRTDAEGRFELSGLNPEVYQLQISDADHTTETILDRRVVEGGTDDIGVIALRTGGTVSGTVYDKEGQPMAGAEVSLTGVTTALRPSVNHTAVSDANGVFRVSRVPDGTYTMSATGGGPVGNPFDKILDMKNSEVRVTIVDGVVISQDLYLGGN